MLPFALHDYQAYVRTSTGATSFSLVYEMEVVLPFEVDIPSLRAQAHFDQLNVIEGKRLAAMSHGRLYQSNVKNAFDRRVCLRKFSEGDLVLKKLSQVQKDHRGIWAPNYEAPFVVKKAFSGIGLLLMNMDDEELPSPMNYDIVK